MSSLKFLLIFLRWNLPNMFNRTFMTYCMGESKTFKTVYHSAQTQQNGLP